MNNFRLAAEDVDGVAGLRAMAFSYKSLQRADGDRRVKLSAAACGLTRMPAHAAADGGERVGGPGITIGFFIAALRVQRDVPPGLSVDRARLHAGEVCLQPLQIHE